MSDGEIKIDDLQYDWPVNILTYESRVFMGMSLQELLLTALPGVLILILLGSPVFGGLAAVISFLLVRKFEALGDRNVIFYAVERLQHNAKQEHIVTLPVILPSGDQDTFIVTDLDGQEVVRFGE